MAGGAGIGMGPARRPRPLRPLWPWAAASTTPRSSVLGLEHALGSHTWKVTTPIGVITVTTRELTNFGWWERRCLERGLAVAPRPPTRDAWLDILRDAVNREEDRVARRA